MTDIPDTATILESITDAFYALDREWRFTYVNAAGERLHGRSRADLLGRDVWEEFPEAVGTVFQRQYQTAMRDNVVVTFEAYYAPLSAWLDTRVFPSETGLSIYIRDISDRFRARQALEESEGDYRSLFETMAHGVVFHDSAGRIVSANPAAERILGLSLEQMQGKTSTDPRWRAVREDGSDLPGDEHPAAYALRTGRSVDSFVMGVYVPERDEYRWISVSARLRYHSGEPAPYGAFATFEDITEQRRANEERRRLASIVTNNQHGIVIVSLDGCIESWNRGAETIYGYAAEEVIGKSVWQVVPEDKAGEPCDYLSRLREGERVEAFETTRVRKDGRQIDVSLTCSPVLNERGEPSGASVMIHDITERKRLQAQVMQSEKLASLGELAAGVAHEINNPLAAISGAAQLLEMHEDPTVREDAEIILRMTHRATEIVRSLLTFARQQRSDKCHLDVNMLVPRVLEMVRYKLRKAGIEPETFYSDCLPKVLASEGQLQQVLLNLINNAEHALRSRPENDRSLVIATGWTLSRGQPWVTLSVEDNGGGIPADILPRIFDPFFTTKPQGEGTGLGLPICHGIVEEHGGKLTVASEAGRGATFTVLLPAVIAGKLTGD